MICTIGIEFDERFSFKWVIPLKKFSKKSIESVLSEIFWTEIKGLFWYGLMAQDPVGYIAPEIKGTQCLLISISDINFYVISCNRSREK